MTLWKLFCLLRHKQYCSACVAARQLLDQARNQLGQSEELSERGPNFLNYVQYFQTMSNTFFPRGTKKILGGASPRWLQACVRLVVQQ